jgi:hypothetical protein
VAGRAPFAWTGHARGGDTRTPLDLAGGSGPFEVSGLSVTAPIPVAARNCLSRQTTEGTSSRSRIARIAGQHGRLAAITVASRAAALDEEHRMNSVDRTLSLEALWGPLSRARSGPVADWIGNRWPPGSFPLLPDAATWADPVTPAAGDGFRAGAAEWAGIALAVHLGRATGRLNMVELGASQAPWCLSWVRSLSSPWLLPGGSRCNPGRGSRGGRRY